MANSRTAVFNEGGNTQYETYKIDNLTITYDATVLNGSAQVGLKVVLLADNAVELANKKNSLGRLVSVDKDGFCIVKRRRNSGLDIAVNVAYNLG